MTLGVDDVRKLLRKACDASGTQARWALENNLSPAYVSDVMLGRREPGPAILDALGLKSETHYVKG